MLARGGSGAADLGRHVGVRQGLTEFPLRAGAPGALPPASRSRACAASPASARQLPARPGGAGRRGAGCRGRSRSAPALGRWPRQRRALVSRRPVRPTRLRGSAAAGPAPLTAPSAASEAVREQPLGRRALGGSAESSCSAPWGAGQAHLGQRLYISPAPGRETPPSSPCCGRHLSAGVQPPCYQAWHGSHAAIECSLGI